MSGAGKGDTYRKVDIKKFNANYESIFGKKDELDYQKNHFCNQNTKPSQYKASN